MAKTKAQLEQDAAEYIKRLGVARSAALAGLLREAIEYAKSAWPFIDGMMQFERRFNGQEISNVEAIDIVLRHAPLLFDFESLNQLDELLKAQKRIDKNASDDLAGKLSSAKTLMWEAYRLWQHIEDQVDVRQDELRRTLGGDQDRWRWLAEAWEGMQLLVRTPERNSYRLRLRTRTDEPAKAKCPSCGTIAKGPKGQFFADAVCPGCRGTVVFTLLVAD